MSSNFAAEVIEHKKQEREEMIVTLCQEKYKHT